MCQLGPIIYYLNILIIQYFLELKTILATFHHFNILYYFIEQMYKANYMLLKHYSNSTVKVY